jgi:hypothetical protein
MSLRPVYWAAGLSAILVALSACNGIAPATPAVSPHETRNAQSWISPEAVKATSLLYISDLTTYEVYIYTFPGLKLVGKLTGFSQPQGECSDSAGDVWIVDTNTRQMFEFRHALKHAVKTLIDPTGYPVSCAIDPTTGNLAVTNIYDFSGAGGVLIYRHATGTPGTFSNPRQFYYYFAGYDAAGDLYVSGQDINKAYMLSVLPKGKSSMSTVSLKGGKIGFPGTVQWVRSTLVLGDQECNHRKSSCLFEASVSGTTAKISHVTAFTGACDVAQAVVVKNLVAGGDYQHCIHGTSSADIWAFPAGGVPIKRAGGVRAPVGAAISTP